MNFATRILAPLCALLLTTGTGLAELASPPAGDQGAQQDKGKAKESEKGHAKPGQKDAAKGEKPKGGDHKPKA